MSAAMDPKFIKGDQRLGDTRLFTELILKKVRQSTRMQTWSILQVANMIGSYCDDVTRTAIDLAITNDNFDCGVGG